MSALLSDLRRRSLRVGLVVVLLAGVAVSNGLYFGRVAPHFDFVAFWSAGRAVVQGQSPYDADVMARLQAPAGYSSEFYSPFYYPLWTGMFFVPLGLLPLRWAAAAWQSASQVMLVAALGLVASGSRWRPGPWILGLVVLASLAYHPALLAFLDSQLSVLLLFLLCASYYLLAQGEGQARQWVAGGVLGVTVIKPQLAVVVVPALLAYLALRRRWSGLAGFAIVFAGMVGASWLMSPGWVAAWLGERREQMVISRIVPSLWGLAHDVSPQYGVVLAVASCTALLGWLGYLWWRERDGGHFGLLLALSVIVGQLVVPFLWVYDQTLLLFPFVVGMAQVSARRRRAVWWSVLLAWAVFAPYGLYALAHYRGRVTGNAFLPIALLAMLVASSPYTVTWTKNSTDVGGKERELGVERV